MIKLGHTDSKGNPYNKLVKATLESSKFGPKRDVIATLKKKAAILKE